MTLFVTEKIFFDFFIFFSECQYLSLPGNIMGLQTGTEFETILQKGKHTMQDLKNKRDKIWKEAKGICSHCGHKFYGSKNRTVDHFIPKSYLGSNDERNLFALCKKCNEERGNVLVELNYYKYASDNKKMMAYQYIQDHNTRTASMI